MDIIDVTKAYVILAGVFIVGSVLSVVVPALCRAAHAFFADLLDHAASDIWR